jgi:hypothetical protein
MGIVAFVGASIFLLLTKPLKEEILLGANKLNLSESLISHEITEKTVKKESFTQDIKETFHLMFSKRMLHCMPLILFSSFSLTIQSGNFIPMMFDTMQNDFPQWDSNYKLSMVLFAMTPLGLGEIVGGLIMANISDKLGNHGTLKYILVLITPAFSVLFATLYYYKFNALVFVMTFFWGLMDVSLSTFIIGVLAFEFDSQITPFSV